MADRGLFTGRQVSPLQPMPEPPSETPTAAHSLSPGAGIGMPSLSLLVLALLGPAPPTHAGFGDPSPVASDSQTQPPQTEETFAVGHDFFDNLVAVYRRGGELIWETLGRGGADRHGIGPGTSPSIAFHPLGAAVAYAAEDPDAGGRSKLFVVTRSGGQWKAPRRAGEDPGADSRPCLKLTTRQVEVIVCEHRVGAGGPRVQFLRGDGPPIDLGDGERPVVVLDARDRAHVFFLRQGDIRYARESLFQPGLFPLQLAVTQTPETESPPRAAVVGERVLLLFERGGALHFSTSLEGDFQEGRVLVEQGASQPAIAASAQGAVAIAYASGADIYTAIGTADDISPASPVRSTPGAETSPLISVDTFANICVTFLRGTSLYYSTNAGPPQARFEAAPMRGEAPLPVRFQDQSLGDITAWEWDFGDGSASSETSPQHTFTSSGEYVVQLRVSGPGGPSPIAHRRTVLVQDPRNELVIQPVSVFPGQREVHIPVIATHEMKAQGFTIAATYDPEALRIDSVIFSDSNITDLRPELFAVNVSADPAEPFVTAGILFDIVSPFDGRTIPPGSAHRIANIIVDVPQGARPGTRTQLRLQNEVGRPPLNNIFTIDGHSVLPVLGSGGWVDVQHLVFPPPRFFLRGDADGNSTLNLTDAVASLGYLFGGGVEPPCLDAMDLTDDGIINIADPVFLLNFLFRGGSLPAPPYPGYGLDPTDDGLPDCLLR